MSENQYIHPKGNSPTGRYSPGVVAANISKLLTISGQGPMDPETGEKYLGDDVSKQARLALANFQVVVEAAGFTMADVIQVRLILTNMEDRPVVDEVYGEFFAAGKEPAREIFAASGLPNNQRVEISGLAVK